MKQIQQRKMGFLEKVNAKVLHDQGDGCCSLSGAVKLGNDVDFERFKQALSIQFQRHPLLRARRHIEDNQYYWRFDVHFDDIAIQLIETDDAECWEQEFSREILRPFDLDQTVWRASLVKSCGNSYLLIAATHAMSDGLCLLNMIADILRIMIQLENGELPSVESEAIPPSFDEVVDRSLFNPPETPVVEQAELWQFQAPCDFGQARPENILLYLDAEKTGVIKKQCKENGVSLMNAIYAALAQSYFELRNEERGIFDYYIAFNHRQNTIEPISPETIGFYAHQFLTTVEYNAKESFWKLAQQAKKAVKKGLSEYALPPADNEQVYDGFSALWQQKMAKQQFMTNGTLSFVGSVDEVFSGIENHFNIEGVYGTASPQSMVWGLSLFGFTFKGQLFLNLSYPAPAISPEWVEKIREKMLEKLLSLSHGTK